MDAALSKILLEREQLLTRIARQRSDVEVAVAGLAGPVAVIDRAVEFGRFLRAHPLAAGAMVALIVVLSRRTIFGTLTAGLGAWRVLRHVQVMLRRIRILRMARRAHSIFSHIFR